MDRAGDWSLSPAFDVTYNYNREGEWTARHQMSLNGKRDGFVVDDFLQCADAVSMQRNRALSIIEEVASAIAEWPAHAGEAGVPESRAMEIGETLRLELRPR